MKRRRSVAITDFALVPDAQHSNDIANGVEAVQGEVARGAAQDYQFAQFALHAAADLWVVGQDLDRSGHARQNGRGRLRGLFQQEFGQPLQIGERFGRVDYLRHLTGLGRFARLPRTLAAT